MSSTEETTKKVNEILKKYLSSEGYIENLEEILDSLQKKITALEDPLTRERVKRRRAISSEDDNEGDDEMVQKLKELIAKEEGIDLELVDAGKAPTSLPMLRNLINEEMSRAKKAKAEAKALSSTSQLSSTQGSPSESKNTAPTTDIPPAPPFEAPPLEKHSVSNPVNPPKKSVVSEPVRITPEQLQETRNKLNKVSSSEEKAKTPPSPSGGISGISLTNLKAGIPLHMIKTEVNTENEQDVRKDEWNDAPSKASAKVESPQHVAAQQPTTISFSVSLGNPTASPGKQEPSPAKDMASLKTPLLSPKESVSLPKTSSAPTSPLSGETKVSVSTRPVQDSEVTVKSIKERESLKNYFSIEALQKLLFPNGEPPVTEADHHKLYELLKKTKEKEDAVNQKTLPGGRLLFAVAQKLSGTVLDLNLEIPRNRDLFINHFSKSREFHNVVATYNTKMTKPPIAIKVAVATRDPVPLDTNLLGFSIVTPKPKKVQDLRAKTQASIGIQKVSVPQVGAVREPKTEEGMNTMDIIKGNIATLVAKFEAKNATPSSVPSPTKTVAMGISEGNTSKLVAKFEAMSVPPSTKTEATLHQPPEIAKGNTSKLVAKFEAMNVPSPTRKEAVLGQPPESAPVEVVESSTATPTPAQTLSPVKTEAALHQTPEPASTEPVKSSTATLTPAPTKLEAASKVSEEQEQLVHWRVAHWRARKLGSKNVTLQELVSENASPASDSGWKALVDKMKNRYGRYNAEVKQFGELRSHIHEEGKQQELKTLLENKVKIGRESGKKRTRKTAEQSLIKMQAIFENVSIEPINDGSSSYNLNKMGTTLATVTRKVSETPDGDNSISVTTQQENPCDETIVMMLEQAREVFVRLGLPKEHWIVNVNPATTERAEKFAQRLQYYAETMGIKAKMDTRTEEAVNRLNASHPMSAYERRTARTGI